jgi:hypothetical protein
MRDALTAVLTAALPHLRVQETRVSPAVEAKQRYEDGEEEYSDAVEHPEAGEPLTTSPAPRPVVDREALVKAAANAIYRVRWEGSPPEFTSDAYESCEEEAGAVIDALALLPTVSRLADLLAALPHLRVQETPEPGDLHRALEKALDDELCTCEQCEDDGYNDGVRSVIKAVQAVLAEHPTPAPRPVVDREALVKAIHDVAVATDLAKYFKHGDLRRFADAILALLPTEEDTKGEGS